jgi:UDP-glucuronate decarboxylase
MDLIVCGDGSQTRSFYFVDDLVESILSMMKTSNEIIGSINIGNPVEFTMLELAEKIIKLTFSRSKIVFLPLPVNDPTQRKPEILLPQKFLNWKPTI